MLVIVEKHDITKGHFTHETESPWPLHFKHSHWWKRLSRSKFASHYARGTNQWSMWMQDGCIVYMDSYMALNGSCSTVTWTNLGKPLLVGTHDTKPGDHGTVYVHSRWFILFYHVWRSTWIYIHWNNVWLRARSRMTIHYTWGSVAPLHDFGGVLGRPLDTFFWALKKSWSWLLGCVWSGPKEPHDSLLPKNKDVISKFW